LKNKKLVMLSYVFPPRGVVGGSIRIIKFLKYLHELQEQINPIIITPRIDHVYLNDPHHAESLIEEIPPNVTIVRTNSLQPKHPNPEKIKAFSSSIKQNVSGKKKSVVKRFVKQIYNLFQRNILIPDYVVLWIPFMIREGLKQIRNENVEVIYATAPPFSVIIGGAILKKLTKRKLIVDIKDDWVYQTKFLEKNRFIQSIERMLEKFVIKNADKVILVTEMSYDDFQTRYPNMKNKFELITNGCDVSEYEKTWEIEYPKNNKFIFLHAGVINVTRNPINFLLALKTLKEENIISADNFKMEFIGPLPQEVWNNVRELNIDDIVFNSEFLARGTFIDKLCRSDLLLAFNYNIHTLIPGKLYDYWGSRRSILLIDNQQSMAAKFVEKYNLGRSNSFDDVNGIIESIKYFFNKWKSDDKIEKLNVKELHNYDRKNLTKKLIDIFESV